VNQQCCVWVVAITNVCEGPLLTDLVKRGYAVRRMGANLSRRSEDLNSALMTFHVGYEDKKRVHDDILEILDALKAQYHAVIVTDQKGDACWSAASS
jgi:hypothetical protein